MICFLSTLLLCGSFLQNFNESNMYSYVYIFSIGRSRGSTLARIKYTLYKISKHDSTPTLLCLPGDNVAIVNRLAAGSGGDGGGGGRDDLGVRVHDEQNEWDRVATSADCYKFACETGIITVDELFLGAEGGDNGRDTAEREEKARASGKKRKASGGTRVGASADELEAGGGISGDATSTTTVTPPLVLRSLAGVTECFGNFLEDFPFQSLVSEGYGQLGGERGKGDMTGGTGGAEKYAEYGSGHNAKATARSRHEVVVDDPGLLPTERASARLSRAVVLRRGFTLLAECLSKSARKDDVAALLVKEGLWSRNAHLVVIYSLVWPWAGGLLPRASDGDEVEKCERAMKRD